MNLKSADEILSFWFGGPDPSREPDAELRGKWFVEDFSFDAEILHNFLDMVMAARFSRLASWESGPNSCLALLLLLDQFPRNIYRGSGEAYLADALGLRVALNAIKGGLHKSLHVLRRQFYFMPLMHCEDAGIQNFCVRLFEELLAEAPMQYHAEVRKAHGSAVEHRAMVQKFGRFPMRGEILGRDITAQEREYIEEHREF